MTTLIKITFKSTGGEETIGFAAMHRDDSVVLPRRMLLRVNAAIESGEGYAIVGHRNGYSYPLLHRDGANYLLDIEHGTSDRWQTRLADAFLKPSKDQLQAYGRYCHTLSAAAAVGLAGYIAGRLGWSGTSITNAACLFILVGVLFAVGAVFSKGEK